ISTFMPCMVATTAPDTRWDTLSMSFIQPDPCGAAGATLRVDAEASTSTQRRALVGHRGPRRAEILHRRIVQEIRHSRRVEVGVVLHLLAEARVLVSFLEDQAPVVVGAPFEARFDLRPFGERRLESAPELLQALLLAQPPLLEIGRHRSAAPDP